MYVYTSSGVRVRIRRDGKFLGYGEELRYGLHRLINDYGYHTVLENLSRVAKDVAAARAADGADRKSINRWLDRSDRLAAEVKA